MLLSLASAAQPPQCSGQRLLASWPCSANLTIHCGPEGNEQCVASIADCSALLSCAPPNHVRCADGTCTSSAGNCIAAAAPCGVGVLCADGSCGSTAAACTAVPGCPTSAPTRCADGSCATVSSGCATLYPCAPAMERCADGQCALRHRCPPTDGCTLTLPQRCADGRCYAAGGHLKPYELGLGLRLGSGVAPTPKRVSGRSGVPTAAVTRQGSALTLTLTPTLTLTLTLSRSRLRPRLRGGRGRQRQAALSRRHVRGGCGGLRRAAVAEQATALQRAHPRARWERHEPKP